MEKLYLKFEFHKTDVDIWGHTRGRKTPYYSLINTVDHITANYFVFVSDIQDGSRGRGQELLLPYKSACFTLYLGDEIISRSL